MIGILDCTLRDGGLTNDFKFSKAFIANHIQKMIEAQIDIIELGYRRTEGEELLACCDEAQIKAFFQAAGIVQKRSKFAFMMDANEFSSAALSICPCQDSVFDVVRLAYYEHQHLETEAMAKRLIGLGYSVWLNLMAVSQVPEQRLIQILQQAAGIEGIEGFYLVDSYGALLPEHIHEIGQLMHIHCHDIKKGIHTHNNLQLAVANCLMAKALGFDYYDGSMQGLGRGGGNCPLEILLPVLKGDQEANRVIYNYIETQARSEQCAFTEGPFMKPSVHQETKNILTGFFNIHPVKGTALESLEAIYMNFQKGGSGHDEN